MKRAFTLSEILVCVGIIGVISAFMLGSVRTNYDKQNIMLFKKTFKDIQEICAELITDTSLFPDIDEGFKIRIKSNGGGNEREDAVFFCEELTRRLIGNDINCDITNATDESFTPNITLSNGVQIAGLGRTARFTGANLANFIEDHIDICVDTNGNNRPNLGCNSGNTAVSARDRFRIRIYSNGKVTTDSSWNFENAIFLEQNRGIDLNSEDFAD